MRFIPFLCGAHACSHAAAHAHASDVFVSSQHKAAALDTGWFRDAFASEVTHIGHTLLVLQPWYAPLPLTRSWCLWEIFSTLNGDVELQIVLSPAQREAFLEALVRELCWLHRFRGTYDRINRCLRTRDLMIFNLQ